MNIKVMCPQIGAIRKFHDTEEHFYHSIHVTEIGVLEIHRNIISSVVSNVTVVAAFPKGNWMIAERLLDDEN